MVLRAAPWWYHAKAAIKRGKPMILVTNAGGNITNSALNELAEKSNLVKVFFDFRTLLVIANNLR